METPYAGRAIVTDNFDQIQIVVPARRNYLMLAFMALWICGWTFGGYSIGLSLFQNGVNQLNFEDTFQIVWLCGWALGLIFVVRTVLWTLIGKETITAGQGLLTISRNLRLLNRQRVYDMNEATNFYVRNNIPQNRWGVNNSDDSRLYNTGTIHFDYGMKTISFAEGIDEAEANYILKLILDKGQLTKRKF